MELATPSGQYPIVVQSFVHLFPLPSCNINIEIYFILPFFNSQLTHQKIGKTTIYLEPHMLMARQCLLNDYIYIYICMYVYIYVYKTICIHMDIYTWKYKWVLCIFIYISSYIWFIFPSPFIRCKNWPIPACSSDRVNSRPRRLGCLTTNWCLWKSHEENSESLLCCEYK